MTGFDFDEAFDECAKIAQPVIPLGDGWTMTTLMGKDGARALVTKALEAAKARIRAMAYGHLERRLALHDVCDIIDALIPKPPAPPDPDPDLWTALRAVTTAGKRHDAKEWCDCCFCAAARVLASKPKEAQP